jgi:hypothetical protein
MSKTAYKSNRREVADDNQDYFNKDEVGRRPSARSNRYENDDFDDQESQLQMMSDRTGKSARHNMPET